MAGAPTTPVPGPTPGVLRRLACFVYEGVLLFGVWMVAGWLWSALTQQRHALHGRHGLMAFLFIVMTLYFSWFWSHGGQTVAMKAWHIRVVDRHGAELTQRRALARSLLAWSWIVPATAAAPRWVTGTHDGIAVRVSAHPGVVALCEAFGGAIVSTSANRAGKPAANAFAELDPAIVDVVYAVLEGETGGLERPSAIRDARSGSVLRV